MRVNEAKGVLVNEIARQANLEGISLSDLERRMLYFTESGDCPEDVFELNDAFEAEYDTSEYEKKISGLAKRAYRRLKKENSAGLQVWDQAVKKLNEGDHYIMLMVRSRGKEKLPLSFWKTMGLSFLLVLVLLVILVTLEHYDYRILSRRGNGRGILYSGTDARVPVWIQRSLLAVLIIGYLYAILPPTRVNQLVAASRKIAGIFRKG
jgi:hypothetical protein